MALVKRKKWIFVVCIIGICLILFLLFFPVKKSVRLDTLNQRGSFFIVEPIAVTGYNWRIIGDENGYYSNETEKQPTLAIIYGEDPNLRLSLSVRLDSPNKYIIYGWLHEEFDNRSEPFSLIGSRDFDIIGPIIRGSSFRLFPSGYLTPLDYQWFWISQIINS